MLPARMLRALLLRRRLDFRLSDFCLLRVFPRDKPDPADGDLCSDGTRNDPTSMSSTSSR
jgi:hypothetical protein